jgi:hypothetical protein
MQSLFDGPRTVYCNRVFSALEGRYDYEPYERQLEVCLSVVQADVVARRRARAGGALQPDEAAYVAEASRLFASFSKTAEAEAKTAAKAAQAKSRAADK